MKQFVVVSEILELDFRFFQFIDLVIDVFQLLGVGGPEKFPVGEPGNFFQGRFVDVGLHIAVACAAEVVLHREGGFTLGACGDGVDLYF